MRLDGEVALVELCGNAPRFLSGSSDSGDHREEETRAAPYWRPRARQGGAPSRLRECPCIERLKCRIHNSLQPQTDARANRYRARRAGARYTGGAPSVKPLSPWERGGGACSPIAASVSSATICHSHAARSYSPTRPGAHLCATGGEPLGEAGGLASGVARARLRLSASANGG